MAKTDFDAIIVGSGPNGLSAAIALQQSGLSVLIVQAKPTIGGGLRSAELTLPGFIHDICSAIHPLAIASPFFSALPLAQLRGDTKANTILEGDHTQGLDFIHNVAVDQHILPRNRQFDQITIIKKYPSLLGIGIDESTAIVVKQNQFEVIGNSVVGIYDIANFDGKKENTSGESGNNGPFFFLSKGQKFDLKERIIVKTK